MTPVEQHHAELAGERLRDLHGFPAGDGEGQFRERVTGMQQGHEQAPYPWLTVGPHTGPFAC